MCETIRARRVRLLYVSAIGRPLCMGTGVGRRRVWPMSSSSWRTAPLPAGWHRTQPRILKRDGRRCYSPHPEVCIGTATEVDHIVPGHLGGTDADDNLAAICTPCHRRKTAREARAAQPSRKRPSEQHPGRL